VNFDDARRSTRELDDPLGRMDTLPKLWICGEVMKLLSVFAAAFSDECVSDFPFPARGVFPAHFSVKNEDGF